MLLKRYSVLMALFFLLLNTTSKAQCSVVSTNGWTATITITPVAVIPEFSSCPYYYHYEVRYNYTITFTGSTVGRSINYNAYFTCSGGTGGNPYNALGNFTANSSGTMATNNNSRQYTAVSTNNYGSNPSCSTVTLSDINCTSVRLDYWGTGVTNGTIYCALTVAPLPIELIDFKAKAADHKVKVSWTTASETNNNYFAVEKSTDGVNFTDVEQIKGAGNSTGKMNYSAEDNNPYTGLSYYRLRQVDFNGALSYSDIAAVEINASDAVTNAYPNPTNGSAINIYVSSASADVITADIYNPLGQHLSQVLLKPSDKGLLDQPIDLPEEGSLFFITLMQNGKIIGHHKLIVGYR